MSSALLVSLTLLAFFCSIAESGPMKRRSRMVREVYPPDIETDSNGNQAQVCIVGDVVYGMDETVPAEQPCLKCKCQPPGVQCETIQCVKRPGCKAIHKPNKCCPDYQCECEHNGKIYANGEKLETPPGGECKVCYCRGGEVQCAEVSCYIRNDCEAKRVPGTCCPKYDNCPPIDPIPERSSYTTEILLSKPNKDQYDPWLVTGSSNSTQDSSVSTSNDGPDENKIPDTHYRESATTSSYKSLEVEALPRETPKITIQEIIPERKEIPITAPPKIITEPQGTLLIEEAEDFLNHSNDLVVTDADADSSEISEVFQQPPPVLRIGDKLLFLKQGEFVSEKDTSTPSSIITIIGAEGLQRGFEDSIEVHEMKIDYLTDEENHTETPAEDSERTLESVDSKDLNLLVLNTAASTHILSLVKRKNQPTTTELPTSTDSSSSTEGAVAVSSPVGTSNLSVKVDDLPPTTSGALNSLTTEAADTDVSNETATEKSEHSTSASTEQHEVSEVNPAYPPLSEILSPTSDDTSQRFDIEDKEDTENTTFTETSSKILPEILDIISNKTSPKNITHKDWLKTNADTLINLEASLPEELLNQPAPSDYEVSNSTEADGDIELTTLKNPETENSTSVMPVKTEKVTTVDSAPAKESLEEVNDSSGESTTPKNNHSFIVSENENASVEANEDQSEASDMVQVKEAPEASSQEKTTSHDVQMIDNVNESKKQTDLKATDVEIIDTVSLQKPTIEKSSSATSAPDFLFEADAPLKIIKREYSGNDDGDEEMDEEEEEAKKRDEEVFRQLLEDTSTPRISRQSPMEASESISNALARYSLKEAISDPNIIGLVSSFFDNQRRQ